MITRWVYKKTVQRVSLGSCFFIYIGHLEMRVNLKGLPAFFYPYFYYFPMIAEVNNDSYAEYRLNAGRIVRFLQID